MNPLPQRRRRTTARAQAAVATALVAMLIVGCGVQPSPLVVRSPSVVPSPAVSASATPAPAATDPAALRDRLASLVLQPEDLAAIGTPSDFERFDEGAQLRSDQPTGARSDPRRSGRLDGWKARYRRADPAASGGALVIESRVDLFSDPAGATADLQALASDAPRTGARVATPTQSVGEAAVALVSEQATGPSIAYYTVAWRRGPLLASVLVSGFKGAVSLDEAAALAEIVDRRLKAATGG